MLHSSRSVGRPSKSRALAGLLLVGALVGTFVSGASSLAFFTGQAVNGSNSLTAGTVVISTTPATAIYTVSPMMPGDTDTYSLVVTNGGTAALRYAMSSVSTNADTKNLRTQVTATIKGIDVTTPATPCDDFDGASIYATGALNSAAFGSNVQGAQAGDRTLAAGASETLCFQLNLPMSTNNTFQGAATTTTFTFDAEQTANNP
jgi:hypothetical protein